MIVARHRTGVAEGEAFCMFAGIIHFTGDNRAGRSASPGADGSSYALHGLMHGFRSAEREMTKLLAFARLGIATGAMVRVLAERARQGNGRKAMRVAFAERGAVTPAMGSSTP